MFTVFSIKRFLLFNLISTVFATIILTTLGNYYIDSRSINNNLDKLLVESGLLLKTITNSCSKITETPPRLNLNDVVLKKYSNSTVNKNVHYKLQIWDSKGKLSLNSDKNTPSFMPIGKPGLNNKIINGQKWRTYTIYDIQHAMIFIIAERYAIRHALIRNMIVNNTYLMLFVYPLSGFFIWLITSRGLKSIRFFTKELAARAADHLNPVDLNKVPIEISPFVDELNKLFLRLQQAFEREQRFAADAAHELHTPLAALKTQAQIALKATDPQECYAHLKQVIASVDRCSHIIQQLLTLCRLSPETIMPEHFTRVDISSIAAEVIAQLAPLAILKQIEIELVAPDSEYVLLGNATGLHVLIRNLVDNAIRYTSREGTVIVSLFNSSSAITLQVTDNGPGIPAKLRARVFERFFRLLGTNAQGSGLGLAIVEQITQLHKGTITLSTPKEGTGLQVEIQFPLSKVINA